MVNVQSSKRTQPKKTLNPVFGLWAPNRLGAYRRNIYRAREIIGDSLIEGTDVGNFFLISSLDSSVVSVYLTKKNQVNI